MATAQEPPIDNTKNSVSVESPAESPAIEDLSINNSDENTKIIVLQLSFDSTEDTVREYFSAYGEIDKLDLKRYGDGTSRGFAFIIFTSEESVQKVLSGEEHIIDGRKVTVEKAKTRTEKNKTNKIFIGKLPSEITEDNLRNYFSAFGEIDEIQFVYNKQTDERKTFCFIQFKDVETVEKITEGKIPPESTRHSIEAFQIDCKKKFDDNHPIQRKIKLLERQRKGLHFNGYGPPVGPEFYGPPQHYGGSGYYHNGGDYGYQNGGGYGYDDYYMYNGYYHGNTNHYNGGNSSRGGRSHKNSHNNNPVSNSN